MLFRHTGLRRVASTWSFLAASLHAPIAIVPELKSSRLGCLGKRMLARVAVYTLPSLVRIRNAAHRLRLRLNSLESPWRSLVVVGKQAHGCKLFVVADCSLFANWVCASPLAPRLSLFEAIVAARVICRSCASPLAPRLSFFEAVVASRVGYRASPLTAQAHSVKRGWATSKGRRRRRNFSCRSQPARRSRSRSRRRACAPALGLATHVGRSTRSRRRRPDGAVGTKAHTMR